MWPLVIRGILHMRRCWQSVVSRSKHTKAVRVLNKLPRQYVAADASTNSLVQYRARWSKLLEMEHLEERLVESERLKTWPLERLVRSGHTLPGLSGGRRVGQQFSRDVLRFESKALAQHQHSFAAGDEAILSRQNEQISPIMADGSLRDGVLRVEVCEVVGTSSLTLAVLQPYEGSAIVSMAPPGQLWRLDRSTSSVAYERTQQALDSWTSPMEDRRFRGAPALRRLVVEGWRPLRADRDGSETRSACHRIAAEANAESAPELRLNEPQCAAIAEALALGTVDSPTIPKLSLIQGPPGTGKTATACTLLALARGGVDSPLLACADSNTAVDQLLEGLLHRGVHAVRLGRPSRSEAHLRNATLEAHLEVL